MSGTVETNVYDALLFSLSSGNEEAYSEALKTAYELWALGRLDLSLMVSMHPDSQGMADAIASYRPGGNVSLPAGTAVGYALDWKTLALAAGAGLGLWFLLSRKKV